MGNIRPFRRRLAASQAVTSGHRKARKKGRWPFGGPSLSTVRRWMREAEKAGIAERKGVHRTGKPGRPAVLWGLTAAANERTRKERPEDRRSYEEMLMDERVIRLLKRAKGKPMTEEQIIAAHEEAMTPAIAEREAAAV